MAKTIHIAGMTTVGELADQLNLPVTKLIGELFKNGVMATVNQRIDLETAQIIVEELGLDVELVKQDDQATNTNARRERVLSKHAAERPPIVAVMGHVDHGKTSLLDAILDTKVASGEAGGITQHIAAYQTTVGDRSVTLLDTPGHEAFSALRQRGAALTDVVIIVVAADDGVKPQTVEAIKFAQAANAKIVVAINKVDKPEADVNRVKQQLATDHNLMTEEWGGDTVMVEVSAKTGHNLDKLLELVLLVADLEELKADTSVPAEGLVIESHMEQGRGPVVSVLVEHGILKPGAYVVAGAAAGKVRTLLDYAGRPLKQAGPSTPATITGFKDLPQFGDHFTVAANEKSARQQAAAHSQASRQATTQGAISSAELLAMMTRKREKQLVNIIIKADVQGSLTSVGDSLRLLENDELALRVVGSGVGNITENDVRMAAGAEAIIYGFNVQLPPAVKQLAAREKVQVRIFKVIYELIDDAKEVLTELLAPEVVETEIGTLVIKGVFKTTKDQIICGGEVTKGKAEPGVLARVLRGKESPQQAQQPADQSSASAARRDQTGLPPQKPGQLAEVEATNVQRQHADAKEVFEGEMCGLQLKTRGKLGLGEGDRLEFFRREL